MTSCLISSMNELLLLRIDGAMDALEEPYRESLLKAAKSGLCGAITEGDFSVIASDARGEGAEDAADAGLLALK